MDFFVLLMLAEILKKPKNHQFTFSHMEHNE